MFRVQVLGIAIMGNTVLKRDDYGWSFRLRQANASGLLVRSQLVRDLFTRCRV